MINYMSAHSSFAKKTFLVALRKVERARAVYLLSIYLSVHFIYFSALSLVLKRDLFFICFTLLSHNGHERNGMKPHTLSSRSKTMLELLSWHASGNKKQFS
jgi:hypothetical protein